MKLCPDVCSRNNTIQVRILQNSGDNENSLSRVQEMYMAVQLRHLKCSVSYIMCMLISYIANINTVKKRHVSLEGLFL